MSKYCGFCEEHGCGYITNGDIAKPGEGENGADCNRGNDCQSQVCLFNSCSENIEIGYCAALCADDSECGEDESCIDYDGIMVCTPKM